MHHGPLNTRTRMALGPLNVGMNSGVYPINTRAVPCILVMHRARSVPVKYTDRKSQTNMQRRRFYQLRGNKTTSQVYNKTMLSKWYTWILKIWMFRTWHQWPARKPNISNSGEMRVKSDPIFKCDMNSWKYKHKSSNCPNKTIPGEFAARRASLGFAVWCVLVSPQKCRKSGIVANPELLRALDVIQI